MRMSTRSRYGLRFMAELAANYGRGSVCMKEIATSQDISEKYLSQILITLKSAGLVEGFRGVHGGYVLAKSPEEITIRDIVNVLEGDLSLTDCVSHPGQCVRESVCATQEVWRKLSHVVSQFLESITLGELVIKSCQKVQNQTDMYCI